MKKIPVLIFILTALLFSQEQTVTMYITTPLLPASDNIYISGNQPAFGNWNPGAVKLKRINDSLSSGTFIFPRGTELEFKFTKGSWNSEALNDDKLVPGNHQHKVMRDTTLNFTINHWKSDEPGLYTPSADFKGQVTGEVVIHPQMTGANILPRDVIVWLPPGYSENSAKRYPVLYMHDGQNLFDPKTASFGVDWQIDETADSLIRNGIISELIIVGIYCTADRMTEYTNSFKGHYYMKFVVEKLKPFIDANYRTLPGREHTATGGSSAGGLISFMLLWEHNNVFSKAACISPAFKIRMLDYVLPVLNFTGKKELILYIDNGGKGLEAELQPGIDEMLAALESKELVNGRNLLYYVDPAAEHNESAWAKRTWRFLKFFYAN